MTEIPWWAHVGVGIVVSGFSKFVEVRSKQNMTLFFYIGIIFVLFGVGKIAIRTFMENRKLDSMKERHVLSQHNLTGQRRPMQPNHTSNHVPTHHNNSRNNMHQQSVHSGHLQRRHSSHQQPNHQAAQHHTTYNQHSQQAIFCQNCGARQSPNANFCMMCGNRMR